MSAERKVKQGETFGEMDDHTLPWLIALLRNRAVEMGPRDKTLTLKFCKAGVKKLLSNLEADAFAKSNLLAACEAVLSSPTYGNTPSDEAIAMVEAAIAKAKGWQPEPGLPEEVITHGCHECGEERLPRVVAGKLTCPECGSERIVPIGGA